MLTWLKSAWGKAAASVSLVSPWLRNVAWTISRSYLSLAREGYGQSSVVYACLRLLSQSVPEPPLLAYAVSPDLERVQADFDHPLQRLIRAPNALMTEFEMVELMTLHLGIAGRAHWWKQRNNAGQVVALWPLRPDRVGPRYGGSPQPGYASMQHPPAANGQEVLVGWNYWPPGLGEPMFLPLGDVLSLNLPDPAGETGGIVEGLGPLQVLAREVESDNEATNFVGALLKNSATPGMILRLKQAGIDRETARRIKRSFAAEFGGAQRGQPAILDGDTEFQQVGFSMQQLEFPQLRGLSESRISAAFGVPAILVGLKVGLESGIRATIGEQRKYFAETTLANLWRRISDAFTNQVAVEFGDNLVVRFDTAKVKALTEQARQEVQPLMQAFQLGAVTVDEYRTRVLGLEALPGGAGDVLLIPTTSAPTPSGLDEGTLSDTIAGEDEAAGGKSSRKVLRLRTRKAAPEGTPAERGSAGGPVPDRATPDLARRARARASSRAAALTAAWEIRVADYLRALARDVAQQLTGTTKGVPTAGAPAVGSPKGRKSDLPADQAAALRKLLGELWQDAIGAAYADAADLTGVGISFDVANPNVRRVLDRVAGSVGTITDTTRDAIRQIVAQAADEGWAVEQTKDAVMQSAAFGPSRATTIARTETGTAYNAGSVLGYRDSGVVAKVQVLDGEDFDDACREANGQLWTLDEADANPLQHPRCVRAFAPVLDVAA